MIDTKCTMCNYNIKKSESFNSAVVESSVGTEDFYV